MKYHHQLLTLHGPSGTEPGKWTLSRIGTPEERMSLQREIKVLEEKLQEVEGWEKRVKELEVLLGVEEGVGGDDKIKEEVEGDREESEESLLRAMEKEEQERDATNDVDNSSAVVSASLVSVSEVGSEVDLCRDDGGSQVGVTEDGIVVDVGFEEAVDQEELAMEAEVPLADNE